MRQYKILLYIAAAALMQLCCLTSLRAAEDEQENFNARISAGAEYKINRSLHVFASEEIRLGGKDILDRSHTEAGISYKFTDYLKASVSYTAIAVYKSETVPVEDIGEKTTYWFEWRHRVSGDITGTVRFGQWKLSLRERVQGTYKHKELNNFQQPQTAWVLRSRLKASYKFRSVPLEPYVYFEPRLLLNGAKWSEEGHTTADYESAEFLGHNDVYFNRLRGAAGVEWKLNPRNSFDIYCLYNYLYDKEIDARKEGSKKGVGLKAQITATTGHLVCIGVGYKFSF
ncbi:MAG: DUF2490 domain-containing protein [Bacteroidales bacterium]|nr:DUF2490 domain-containing protein [Bacteroidales bacterium]